PRMGRRVPCARAEPADRENREHLAGPPAGRQDVGRAMAALRAVARRIARPAAGGAGVSLLVPETGTRRNGPAGPGTNAVPLRQSEVEARASRAATCACGRD